MELSRKKRKGGGERLSMSMSKDYRVLQLRWVSRLRSIKFFSLLIISLWDMCNNIQVGVEFSPSRSKQGRFVMEMFISGRKYETLYFGLLEYMAFSNFMGKICSDHDFTRKCTLKYIAH